jgi:hypothetical protein
MAEKSWILYFALFLHSSNMKINCDNSQEIKVNWAHIANGSREDVSSTLILPSPLSFGSIFQ